jgi:hypothetical protein
MRFLVPTAGRDLAPAVRVSKCHAKLGLHATSISSTTADSGLSQKPFPATVFLRWEGRANAHFQTVSLNYMPRSLTSREREVHLYLRFNLDRLSVEQVGLVLPLLHSFDRGRS